MSAVGGSRGIGRCRLFKDRACGGCLLLFRPNRHASEAGMRTLRIAVLAGDGIGPEVIAEGVRVLRAVERLIPWDRFTLDEFSVGAGESLRSGDPLPAETLRQIGECDAALLGAM